jgi:hypothetical protein
MSEDLIESNVTAFLRIFKFGGASTVEYAILKNSIRFGKCEVNVSSAPEYCSFEHCFGVSWYLVLCFDQSLSISFCDTRGVQSETFVNTEDGIGSAMTG